MKQLNELILIFRQLLNQMSMSMCKLAEEVDSDSLLDDWKQVNWELIVESNLKDDTTVFLEPYGSGADFYGESSRILRPEALPTHAVHCYSDQVLQDLLTGNTVDFPSNGLAIESFVTMRNGWYYEEPPFDCVLIIRDDEQFVIGLDNLKFFLSPVSQ